MRNEKRDIVISRELTITITSVTVSDQTSLPIALFVPIM